MHGLNMYDYSARYYESALGRFTSVDPLAEKYYSISPYVYCNNNPMKYIDPTGMIYDDYFNQQGKYLGTDNDPNSNKVRVMDDNTWAANKTGEGTIDHTTGTVISDLASNAGLTQNAIRNIYRHYNETSLSIDNTNDPTVHMAYSYRGNSKTNTVSLEYFALNTSLVVAKKYIDTVDDIKNVFVHETRHYSDRRKMGFSVFINLTTKFKEFSAIEAQTTHPTWKGTSDTYKEAVTNYANSLGLFIPKIHAKSLIKPGVMSAPMKIK